MLTSALRTKKIKKLIPDQGNSISIIQKGRRHTYNANRSLPGIGHQVSHDQEANQGRRCFDKCWLDLCPLLVCSDWFRSTCWPTFGIAKAQLYSFARVSFVIIFHFHPQNSGPSCLAPRQQAVTIIYFLSLQTWRTACANQKFQSILANCREFLGSLIQVAIQHLHRFKAEPQALDSFQICARNVMLTFHPRHSARLAECRMPNTTILERSKCINLHSIKQDALQSYLCVLPGIINTPIKFWSSNLRRHLYIPGAEVYSEAVGVPPWEPSTAGSLGLENALRYVTAMANLWPWSALRFLTCVTVAGFYWIWSLSEIWHLFAFHAPPPVDWAKCWKSMLASWLSTSYAAKAFNANMWFPFCIAKTKLGSLFFLLFVAHALVPAYRHQPGIIRAGRWIPSQRWTYRILVLNIKILGGTSKYCGDGHKNIQSGKVGIETQAQPHKILKTTECLESGTGNFGWDQNTTHNFAWNKRVSPQMPLNVSDFFVLGKVGRLFKSFVQCFAREKCFAGVANWFYDIQTSKKQWLWLCSYMRCSNPCTAETL